MALRRVFAANKAIIATTSSPSAAAAIAAVASRYIGFSSAGPYTSRSRGAGRQDKRTDASSNQEQQQKGFQQTSGSRNGIEEFDAENFNQKGFQRETAAAFGGEMARPINTDETDQVRTNYDIQADLNTRDASKKRHHEPSAEELRYDNARQPRPDFWFDMVSESSSFSSSYTSDGSGKPKYSHDYHRVLKRNDEVLEEERSSGPTSYPERIDRRIGGGGGRGGDGRMISTSSGGGGGGSDRPSTRMPNVSDGSANKSSSGKDSLPSARARPPASHVGDFGTLWQ